MINISEPSISSENIRAVLNCLKSNSVSTYGSEVTDFEKRLTEHCLLDAVAVTSGTSALELSIDCYINEFSRTKKLKIGFCDYTFIATPNAILNTSNTPVPLPCNTKDYLPEIDYFRKLIEDPRSMDFFILTLPFGNFSLKVSEIISICKEANMPVIVDAAASIALDFPAINEILSKCVSICLSFNGNKVITSGAGGSVLSSNLSFIEKVRSVISLNRLANYNHSAPGQNKKMPALNASLGLSQLNELKSKVDSRRATYEIYQKFKRNFDALGFELFPTDQYESFAHWIYFLKPISNSLDVQKFRDALIKNGINTPPFWKPVSQQTLYKKYLQFGPAFPGCIYPDLLQLPMTLYNPQMQIEDIVKTMESV